MKIKQISKTYGKTEVLKNITFDINKGDKVALLGNNGAGKTTLMNIINQSLKATSGNIDYGDMKLDKKNTGYVMQNMSLPSEAKCSEIMELFAHDKESKDYGQKLMNQFKMTSFVNRRFRNLSGGQKQKLFLVSMLQNKPEYFFLDEITTGLDSESRAELFKFLSENPDVQNSTTVLVTHYIEEALQICDRFVIMKEGEIVANLKKSDLVQKEFSVIEFDQEFSDLEVYQLAEKVYKLPKNLIPKLLSEQLEHIVRYERDYVLDLGGLLQ